MDSPFTPLIEETEKIFYVNQKGEPVGQPCPKCHKGIWYAEEDSYFMENDKLVHKECPK